MPQDELNQQVANKTGEDIATIRRMGFSPLTPIEVEERDQPLWVDWDSARGNPITSHSSRPQKHHHTNRRQPNASQS